jgi:hypothetical protein
MVAPAFCLLQIEKSSDARNVARLALSIIIVASLLSGARGAFIFIPVLLAATYLFDLRLNGALQGLAIVVVLAGVAISAVGIDPIALFSLLSERFTYYADQFAYRELVTAIATSPMGDGIGTNTVAARHFATGLSPFWYVENWWAKTVYELGVPGLLTLVALWSSLMYYGVKMRSQMVNQSLRSCAAALTAFIAIVFLLNFKGWYMDIDPINVYFWIFTGLLFSLPLVDQCLTANKSGSDEATHLLTNKSSTNR